MQDKDYAGGDMGPGFPSPNYDDCAYPDVLSQIAILARPHTHCTGTLSVVLHWFNCTLTGRLALWPQVDTSE